MLIKLLAGGTAAALVGVTGATLTASAAPSAAHPRAALVKRIAQHTVHGQVVTKTKDGTFVTHDFIRGTVADLSATSIRVTAADKYAETFSVSGATHVRVRHDGTGHKASYKAVHKGDRVVVLGVGADDPAARWIVVLKK